MIQNLILFFENIILGVKLFNICPHVPVGIIRVFLNFSFSCKSVSKPTKTSEKDHSFYNTVSLKQPHSFYMPQLT